MLLTQRSTKTTPLLDPEALSTTIGMIYECALNPEKWRTSLDHINQQLDAAYVNMTLLGATINMSRLVVNSSWDEAMLVRLMEKYIATGIGIPGMEDILTAPIGEVVSTLSRISKEQFHASEFYRDWAQPQGLEDGCSMNFVRTADRLGSFGFVIGGNRQPIGAEDFRYLQLLGPHVNRAVMIADLFDFKAVQISRMSSALDLLSVPVMVVNQQGKLDYANRSADEILTNAKILDCKNGIVRSANKVISTALLDAVIRACTSNLALGGRGIAIPLTQAPLSPIVAYVLPLRLAGGGIDQNSNQAAIFLSTGMSALPPIQDVLSAIYDLTSAESRVMAILGAGKTPAFAAKSLAISENTLKTHAARIYSKTGVNRQVELVSLVNALGSPTV